MSWLVPTFLVLCPPETAWSSVVTLRKASTVLSTEGSSPRMPALQRAALERVLLPDQALKTLKGGRQGSLPRKMRLGWSRREDFPKAFRSRWAGDHLSRLLLGWHLVAEHAAVSSLSHCAFLPAAFDTGNPTFLHLSAAFHN